MSLSKLKKSNSLERIFRLGFNYFIIFLLIFICSVSLAEKKKLEKAGAEQVDPYGISDPWESYNRSMFSFNDGFDRNVAEPVAKGYDYITPNFMQTGVSNFFDNLSTPSYFLSSLLQGKLGQSMHELGRFVVNTTVGLAGLIDVAKHVDLPKHKEDFGMMFAEWGISPGPYFVIPFVGPSTVRDGVGSILDRIANPMYWIGTLFDMESSDALIVSSSATALEFTNIRASLFDAVDTAKESSLDYYLFIQSSYYQHRKGLFYDGNPPDEVDDDSWMEE